jgi:hypothetical protein
MSAAARTGKDGIGVKPTSPGASSQVGDREISLASRAKVRLTLRDKAYRRAGKEGDMTKIKRARKKVNGDARPIKTKRDYERVTAVLKRLSVQADRDSTAELRLQSLLVEVEKFDGLEDDVGEDFSDDGDYSGPRRRWSDDTSGD